jgi:hypothetical protein
MTRMPLRPRRGARLSTALSVSGLTASLLVAQSPASWGQDARRNEARPCVDLRMVARRRATRTGAGDAGRDREPAGCARCSAAHRTASRGSRRTRRLRDRAEAEPTAARAALARAAAIRPARCGSRPIRWSGATRLRSVGTALQPRAGIWRGAGVWRRTGIWPRTRLRCRTNIRRHSGLFLRIARGPAMGCARSERLPFRQRPRRRTRRS